MTGPLADDAMAEWLSVLHLSRRHELRVFIPSLPVP